MTHKVILFGSIGTLINTSNLQRCAFNQAFPNEDLVGIGNLKTIKNYLQSLEVVKGLKSLLYNQVLMH